MDIDIITTRAAYELAIKFEDESDTPARFKKKSKNSKYDKDSKVERVFQNHLSAWMETIHSILKIVPDNEQAWRFIRIKPKIDNTNIDSAALCEDFKAFNTLLIQRRDHDGCSPDELGKLCMLLTDFQREIEKQINKDSP